ncbi:putative Dol-P-Glc:Glc(2)Man(9)GlcNAc(2)-PP-Dol alpha-1,2-glucosyltransferase [Paramacrobiotus metropolitanus]|uniref:putative Dol-P-Glc:Glc(2)Man(9)GlcNAc(2)-PP-Dol alpha-1,2-glucosyltransferase n=1 Tax=Paramacrobiotus metropolitanus TaxID=2943436 RepID=UPI002445CEFE|nr:putative Dol-P-Glc:Glc(2)Man(9)GlcNAc(2)-PP-Dol alpha-1,2-glucosyltransferase [Paramacrobiotus metropolitanus]
MHQNRGLLTTVVIVCGIVSFQLFSNMYYAAPEPYVDEEFHIPQALRYCNGNFSEWDPKLTTLPGLYFVSLALWKVIPLFIPIKHPCVLWNLRLTNFFFGLATIPLFLAVLKAFHHQHGQRESEGKLLFTAVNMATFPLLYFFMFLYYTDQASTFFVFLTAFFHLREARSLAALASAAAVFTRQTNVMWVAFFALWEIWRNYQIVMANVLKKDQLEKISPDEDLQVLFAPFVSLKRMPTAANFRRLCGFFMGVIFESVPRIWGYGLVMLAFLTFVIINQGIVVGDRSAHQPVIHISQLFYFASFVLFFASPFVCSPTKLQRFLAHCYQYPLIMIVALKGILLSIKYFSYVHLYLISDNRHYIFYIWKRIFEKDERVKYILAPVYLYGLWAIFDVLKYYKFFRILAFFLVIILTLVPQQLLEFRYFIVPYLIFRMHFFRPSYRQLVLEFLLFQAVNAITLYLFIYKPFYWNGSQNVQHFMW